MLTVCALRCLRDIRLMWLTHWKYAFWSRALRGLPKTGDSETAQQFAAGHKSELVTAHVKTNLTVAQELYS